MYGMGIKLTEREISRLACPPGKRDCMVFDTEQRGLAVRVVTSGSKSYLAQYVTAGRKRRVPLGSVDAISLAAARTAARTVMGQVAGGTDPAAQRKAAVEDAKVEAQRERMTLARLVDDWTRLHLSTRRLRYQAEAAGTIKRVFADWLNRPAERLARKDVVQLLDRLPPSMARATAAYGRACFAWGAKRDSVAGNPFVALPVQATARRDRVLDDSEAARVWKAAAGMSARFGPLVRLLLLTGQRREEVESAQRTACPAWCRCPPRRRTYYALGWRRCGSSAAGWCSLARAARCRSGDGASAKPGWTRRAA